MKPSGQAKNPEKHSVERKTKKKKTEEEAGK